MTSVEFRAIGKAIYAEYGEYWAKPFAAALGATHRIVQRYGNGQFDQIPDDVAERARALMRICAAGRNRAEQTRNEP